MWQAIRNIFRGAPTGLGVPPQEGAASTAVPPLYSSDSPVGQPTQDRFQRWPYSQRLAEGIAKQGDQDSLVIGIYGAWGEGKTSVLNFVEVALGNFANVIPFRFNPWRYPDEAELLRDFFEALAQKLGKTLRKNREKVGDILRDYGTIAGGVMGAATGGVVSGGGEAAQAAGHLLARRSLEDRKKDLERLLLDSGQRVVVMIDDIDRLARREIQAVFRLIKLTADFKNTTYILAFDPEMVASALGEQFGTGDAASGAAFIEKIVQVPLPLPFSPRSKVRSFALEAVDRVLNALGMELDEADIRRFVTAFDSGVLPAIRTPRDAARLANVVAFAMPLLDGEVNACDFLLVQALQVFYPSVSAALRRDPKLALGRLNPNSDHKEQEAAKKEAEELLGTVSPDLRDAARELLEELFPRIPTGSGSAGYGAQWEERWAKEKRAASRSYFNRYFSLAIGEAEASDLEVEAIVGRSEPGGEGTDAVLRGLLAQQLDGKRDEDLIMKLRLRAGDVSPPAARRLAMAVASCGARYARKSPSFGVSVSSQAAMLVVELLERCEEKSRVAVAGEAVRASEVLPFALEFVAWVQREDSEREKGLPDPEWQAVRRVLAERVRDELTASDALLQNEPRTALRALGEWGGSLGFEQPRAVVSAWLDGKASRILALVRAATRTLTDSTGNSRNADLHANGYRRIAALIDPQVALKCLQSLFAETLAQESFTPARGHELDDLTLARQFAWLHEHRAELEGKE